MGRVVKTIEIEGEPAVALFDTGAVYTYVRASLVEQAPKISVSQPVRVMLGGKAIEVREVCLIQGKIDGLDFFTDAVPVDDLGRVNQHELDAIIGARTMEQWEIRINPKDGTLELEGLKRRELTEYAGLQCAKAS